MAVWSWWLSGLALAAIPILNWTVTHRVFGVTGHYTALIDRLREGKAQDTAPDMQALLAAMREETVSAFGADAVDTPEPDAAVPVFLASQSPGLHLIFFGGLALGGLLSVLLAGDLAFSLSLRTPTLSSISEHLRLPEPLILAFGGLLVGAGTRMAGGCTSGHGLCGVSRIQAGSLLATAAFFGAGVAMSFALGALR